MSQMNNRPNQGDPGSRSYRSGEGQDYGSGGGISPGRMNASGNRYAADGGMDDMGGPGNGYAQAGGNSGNGGNDAAGGGRSRRSIAADRMMQGRRNSSASRGSQNSASAPAVINASQLGNIQNRDGMSAGGSMQNRDGMSAGGNMQNRGGGMSAGGNMQNRGGMSAGGNMQNRGGGMSAGGNMQNRGGMSTGGNMQNRGGGMSASGNIQNRVGMSANGSMPNRGTIGNTSANGNRGMQNGSGMPTGGNAQNRGGMPASGSMQNRGSIGGISTGGNGSMQNRTGAPAGGSMQNPGGMSAGGTMQNSGGMSAGGTMQNTRGMSSGGNMQNPGGMSAGSNRQDRGDIPVGGNSQRQGYTTGDGYVQGRESALGAGSAQRRGGAAGRSQSGQSGYPDNRAAVAGGNRPTGRNGAAAGRQGTSSPMNASQAGSGGYGSGGGRNTASGGRGGQGNQPPRSGAGRQPVRNTKKKRRPPFDGMKIAIVVAGLILVVLCVAGAAKFIGGRQADEAVVTTPSATETQTEAELQKEVTVDGISITGMSREEARSALMKQYEWGMKVTYEGKERAVKDLLGEKIDALLSDIYTGEPKESYTLDTNGLDEAVEAEVKAIAAEWDVPAKNGSISSFDKETGAFVYAGEQNGRVIAQDQLAADIKAQLEARNFKAVVQAKGMDKAPEITEAQAKEMYQVIGTYTTTTTTNKDRNTNIRLASDALNGVILQPGEEFSFNKATGERSPDKGYRPAGAYLNGELIEEPGGGVCQVSSTLYNAVVFAGLTTTERHAHSYEPSYVTPGEDAMVSYGGPDMKFVNSSPSAIAIRASFSDRKLKLSIVGIPILEEGVELSMSSQKTGELDPPAPVYEEDQTIEPGTEKVVIEAKKGSRWVTNLITKKDGAVVSDEFFHNSTYRGKPATIKRNTSGVMIQPETSSQPEESSSAAAGETTAPDAQNQTTAPAAEPGRPTETTEGQKGPGVTGPTSQPAQGQPSTSQPATQPSTGQSATQPGGPGDGGGTKPAAPSADETVAIPPSPLGL